MATPDLTSCFATFVDAHQLTTLVRKHKQDRADLPRLAHTSRYPAGRIGAGMNKGTQQSLNERLDHTFRQADAGRERAKVLMRAVERDPTEAAKLAREVIPMLMEQERARAAQICGVDVADPDWSSGPDWGKKAESLDLLDLLKVYQIGNSHLVFGLCKEEIAGFDSDASLSEEDRAVKICEAVLSVLEDLAAVWLHGLAELSALACFSDGEDSKAAQVAKDEEGRRLAGHLATKISLGRNLRAAKALNEIREHNKPPHRERFEALLRELYVEAPKVWAERSSTDQHLRATRSATLKRVEGRDRQGPGAAREIAAFAEREALLRKARDAQLTPREHELFEFFIDNPTARNADAARTLDIAVGTVKSLKSRIAKRLRYAS